MELVIKSGRAMGTLFKSTMYTIGVVLGLGFTIMAMPFVIAYALYKEFLKNKNQ